MDTDYIVTTLLKRPNTTQESIMKELLFLLGFVAISVMGLAQNEICPGADVLVSAAGMAYSPQDLVVDAGTVVGWVNYDGYHDVNGVVNSITLMPFDNPESFSFEALNGTEEGVCIGTFAFTVPGVYLYDCTSYGHASSGMVGSVTIHISGCMDPLACNYDSSATEDNATCTYPDMGYDCEGNCIIDLDEDGICDTCEEYDYIVVDCDCSYIDPATQTVFFTNVDEVDCISIEDCFCECINDADGDGICDENETSVSELGSATVLIFPNPVASHLKITLELASSLQVFDAGGKVVAETGVVSNWVVDVSAWKKGFYTIKTKAGETHKFIVE